MEGFHRLWIHNGYCVLGPMGRDWRLLSGASIWKGLKHVQPSHPAGVRIPSQRALPPGACFARPGAIGSHPSGMPEAWERVRRRCGQAITEGDEYVAARSPCPFEAVPRWASSSPSPSSNRMLLFVFDSDADTDTDAWGKGSRQEERGGNVPGAVSKPSSGR